MTRTDLGGDCGRKRPEVTVLGLVSDSVRTVANLNALYDKIFGRRLAGTSGPDSGPLTVTLTGSSQAATHEPEEGEPPIVSCGGGAASVWAMTTAPSKGTLRVTTAGSGFDTLLGLFRSAYRYPSPWNLVGLASNDNCSQGVSTSCVTFSVKPGVNYFIGVDGAQGAKGSLKVVITFTPA